MSLICGLPLDMERPCMATMLAPTLCEEGTWRAVTYDGQLAVLVLDRTVDRAHVVMAVRMHHALQRGLFVLL